MFRFVKIQMAEIKTVKFSTFSQSRFILKHIHKILQNHESLFLSLDVFPWLSYFRE